MDDQRRKQKGDQPLHDPCRNLRNHRDDNEQIVLRPHAIPNRNQQLDKVLSDFRHRVDQHLDEPNLDIWVRQMHTPGEGLGWQCPRNMLG